MTHSTDLDLVVRNGDEVGVGDLGCNVHCKGAQSSNGARDCRVGATGGNNVKVRTVLDGLSGCQRCGFILVNDCRSDTAYSERAGEELGEHGDGRWRRVFSDVLLFEY